jgi:hypothetical protein
MGRNRKTTAHHELNGSFDVHPERRAERALEPKPTGPLGDPPKCFTVAGGCSQYTSERLIGIWNEMISEMPPGVGTISDRKLLEGICRVVLRTRQPGATPSDFSNLERMLGKMAMTPEGRSRVTINPGVNPTDANSCTNPFDEIAEETSSARPN